MVDQIDELLDAAELLIDAAPELLKAANDARLLLLRLQARELIGNAPEIQSLAAAINKATK